MITSGEKNLKPVEEFRPAVDDFLPKPFKAADLVARIKRFLHKSIIQNLEKAPLSIHELIIDPARQQVLIKDKPVSLTAKEFNILYILAHKPGSVFTRYQLIDETYNDYCNVTERAIDFQIVKLRKKLEICGQYIETVHGIGYRFKA